MFLRSEDLIRSHPRRLQYNMITLTASQTTLTYKARKVEAQQ